MRTLYPFKNHFWYSEYFKDLGDIREKEYDVQNNDGPVHGYRCSCCGAEMFSTVEAVLNVVEGPDTYSFCGFCHRGLWIPTGNYTITLIGGESCAD